MTAGTVYDCNFTKTSIRVDELIDEPSWEEAPTLDFYVPVTHATPQCRSCGRMLWDERFLYVAIKAYDKNIWG